MQVNEQLKEVQDQQQSGSGGAATIAVAIVLIGVLTAIGWSIALS